ncbi:MAG: TIGR01777 family oxidoreductase [Bacteroidales bacterium]|nr:TIGR01777 family oxidoreductase [Bacteroidales bacterium]
MEIVITGGTGFIGSQMSSYLERNGFNVTAIGRNQFKEDNVRKILEGKDVIINLMGSSIVGIWTKEKKRRIYESRVITTRNLIKEVNACKNPADIFIQASAVGIYDNIHEHQENSKLYAENFLSKVIKDWEFETEKLSDRKFRIVILRLGIVLDKRGGFIKKMLFPFRFHIGIFFGTEIQGFSFVHMEDLNRMIKYIIADGNITGIVNGVAPEYTTMINTTKLLCLFLKPVFKIKIPAVILNIIFGESALVFNEGQKVLPGKLLKAGFDFQYRNINIALGDMISK